MGRLVICARIVEETRSRRQNAPASINLNKASMAEFHIKGHVKREGPLRYVAVLCVYRANSPTESKPVEVIQETATTYALAVERLRALAISAGARIRHEGGDVLVVDLEAVPS